MLYLKSIVLDKFKSFKHAELLFSKGFTCVVGPNGSGKSVIFDALVFGLGEPSLKSLRVDTLDQLINWSAKKKPSEPTIAHLKMELEGDGKAVTVIKAIRSDGKAAYKLDGKTMPRKDIIEFLSREGIRVGDTTTIAQGEINTIATLNNKERRGLIDNAAGIKEYDDKRSEALKELEKMDQNISVASAQLAERQGYLSNLEKEKEAAENYQKMNTRIKNLRFSALTIRQGDLKSSIDSYSSELSSLDLKRSGTMQKLADCKEKRDKLGEESQALAKELNSINSASSETNSKLSVTGNELAKLDVEIPGLRKSIDETKFAIGQYDTELAAAAEKVKLNKSSIEELKSKIAPLEKELGKLGPAVEGVDYEKEISDLGAAISLEENRLRDIESYMFQLQADLTVSSRKKTDLQSELEASVSELKETGEQKKHIESEISASKQNVVDIASTIDKLKKQCAMFGKRLYEIDAERMNLAEQKARVQQNDGNLEARIASAFGENDGFYGKAGSLCRYSAENAYAVEAAAGNRLEYFVVDSIATASRIIEHLKKNGIGRATFIPMEEVNFRPLQKEKGITPVIDVVKFETRFSRAFSFIFNDTYIIPTLNDARKYGIGKHRYVTPEGDIAEQSGIVSGGGMKKRLSIASILSKMQELESERDNVKRNSELAEQSLKDAEKSRYVAEAHISSLESELKTTVNGLARLAKLQDGLSQQIKVVSDSESRIRKELESKDKEKLDAVSSLNSSRQARSELFDKVGAASKSLAKSGRLKEEKERSEKLRQEIVSLEKSIASLTTEASILEQKSSDLSYTISERKKLIKGLKQQLDEKEIRHEVLSKSKAEIEKEISSKSDSSKKIIDRQNAINSDISKLSVEIGKLEGEITGIDRQIADLQLKKATADTRLNDITAELSTSSYQSPELTLLEGKPEEMDIEANTIKGKLEAMGAVNLKAPEVFDEMKKQTDEAVSKVDTLQSEKDAVLHMIEEIDSKKLQTFMDMLNQVNKNFSKLYNYVFPGKASIMLEDETDPLNSGIILKLNDGKSDIPLKSLSGGQKSMVALMLLFSIHLCKKSSLYLFDEVDAALDSENAKLLSKLIKQMSDAAQFIVISHNNSLIVNADTAIGVAMDKSKESKAIGLEISSMIKGKQQ